ncbi:putative transmembrane transcriptional regulator (anti-sigma factor) [Anaerohalosphaera lusitana]|uniref:Putative transmembrane transcriptional regulator (Anti-sigma factor) n=1 Tax=Anaerohalosphaera lusitana TaxID=1936003 RepID=A0A1U9NJI1_9BACT|nr:hypothetical protein [Anaerohalosphaera lusitana]AQT67898.1 putative transmembrane transcriptional regulator (anti-sigma factor) [Anaerohalosphaera lusitana]
MSHLNKEQFEDIIAGKTKPDSHLENCPRCRSRLSDHVRIKDGLKAAFDNVEPPAELSRRLRMSFPDTVKHKFATAKTAGSALAVAASLLLVVILFANSMAPSTVQASPEDLSRIHDMNITGHDKFYSQSDPAKLSAYFRTELGFNPHLPRPDMGLELRGCCVSHFGESVKGSYVVDTPQGYISVVVVNDTPRDMVMHKIPSSGGQTVWCSKFAGNRMAAVQLGEYTYCAVGQADYEVLGELLDNLTSD